MNTIERITASLTTPSGEVKQIPTDWTGIKISQYVTYLKEIEPLFWGGGEGEGAFIWVEILAHFTGISDSDLRKMRIGELLQASELLKFISEPLLDFKAFSASFQDVESKFMVIDGETYHLPESLPNVPMTGLPFGEFYDSMDYWQQGEELLKGKIKVLTKIMAVLVKKEGDLIPLDLTKRSLWIEERAKFWENQNMYQGWMLLFFFLQALQSSKPSTRLFLKAEELQEQASTKESSRQKQ